MRLLLSLALTLAAAPAGAQDMGGLLSKLGGARAGGGASGLLGGAGANNITGLLGYCIKNQLLGSGASAAGSGNAAGLLGKLTGKQGVTQSQGFLAGQQGVVQAGSTGLPLGSLGDTVKQQVCRTVLSRAGGLLGR